jgi:hypothetical protein
MFIFTSDGAICDWDLDLLADIVLVIDKQLVTTLGDWQNSAEAEALGYFDRAEHIMGLGFVACQAYITATCGCLNVTKDRALSVGPRLNTGQRIVQIVNHAANYWKHHDEWHLERTPAHAARILDAFGALAPDHVEYPLSGILTVLVDPEPATFKPLVAMLANWRDELRQLSDAARRGMLTVDSSAGALAATDTRKTAITDLAQQRVSMEAIK